jgi:hypothetical protein
VFTQMTLTAMGAFGWRCTRQTTWRDLITALPEEYQDRFEGQFEDDSDLDRPIDPDDVMCSNDGYFPPGLPGHAPLDAR